MSAEPSRRSRRRPPGYRTPPDGRNPVLTRANRTTSALLGQQTLTGEQAAAAGNLLDLDTGVVEALTLPPVRGAEAIDTTEPLAYRLSEIVQVYGPAISELVREEFGDGIVSESATR